MKIALLVPKFSNFTGDARITEIQAEELIRGGNDVIVFALEADNKPINANLCLMEISKSLFLHRIYRLILFFDVYKILRWLPKFKQYD